MEAVGNWNRRFVGGMAVPFKITGDTTFRDTDGAPGAKPCPLCGGEPQMVFDEEYSGDFYSVKMICRGCGMHGPTIYGLAEQYGWPTLKEVEAMNPEITILESRRAAYLACIDAWNHRVHGREASQ